MVKYGGLMIDVPKLFGQLRLVAHQDDNKVYDKKVDFRHYRFDLIKDI